MRPTAAGELELAPTNSTSDAVAARKRTRLKRQRRAVARKALCVFMSVVLVVGLMPGFVAWGESNQVTTAAADETLDVNDDNAGSENSENSQTQDNPVVTNEEDELDENDDELSDDPDITSDEDDALLGAEETKDETAKALLLATASLPSAEDLVPAKLESADTLGTDTLGVDANSAAGEIPLMTAAGSSYYINYNYYGNAKSDAEGNAIGAKSGATVSVNFINVNNRPAWYNNTYVVMEYGGPNKNGYRAKESKGGSSPMTLLYTVPVGYRITDFDRGTGNTILRVDLESYVEHCAITFDRNGGSLSKTRMNAGYVEKGKSVALSTFISGARRSGYTFSGWNTKSDGSGTHYDEGGSITPTSDITLYAEWTRTLTLVAEGKDAVVGPASQLTFYYDSAGTGRPERAEVSLTGKHGWEASGWTTSTSASSTSKNWSANVAVPASALTAKNTTFYALLQRTLRVKYDANGADESSNVVPEDTTATQYINTRNYTDSYSRKTVQLAEPGDNLKKKGYDFVGWTIDGVLYDMENDAVYTWKNGNATAEVTAYATWERTPPAENKVTVEMEGWTYGETPNEPKVWADHAANTAKVEYFDSQTGTEPISKPTEAGTYWVRATVEEDEDANYLEGTASASFTIAPKEVGISWRDDAFDYDGTAHKPTATVNATDLVGNDACTVDVSGEQINAGSYTAWASGLSNANYALPASGASHAFKINKAALTVKAKDKTITYGDAPQANGVEYQGFVSNEGEGDLTGSLSYAFDYAQYGNVGTYENAIKPSGLGSPNYDITYLSGSLTVNRREVTLLWSEPDSLPYNEQNQTWPDPTVGNTVNGDALGVVWTSGAVLTAKDRGTYSATVESLSGEKAANYTLPANTTGTWSIIEPGVQPMTVSIAGWTYGKYDKDKNGPTVSAAYGKDGATFEYFVDNNGELGTKVEGNDLDADGVPKNAGSYWVVATIKATGTYPGGTAKCAFEITRANLEVWVDGSNVTVGPNDFEPTYTIYGDLVPGDEEDLRRSYIVLDPSKLSFAENTGQKRVYAKWAPGITSHRNYEINFEWNWVTPRGEGEDYGVWSAQGGTFVYDGKTERQISVSGLKDTDTVRMLFGGINTSSNVGAWESSVNKRPVTENNAESLKKLDEYTSKWQHGVVLTMPKTVGISSTDVILLRSGATPNALYTYVGMAVTPAPLVVQVGDKVIEYGDEPTSGSFVGDAVTYKGFVNGETESSLRGLDSPELKGDIGDFAYGGYTKGGLPGRYPITLTNSTLKATNYSITYAPGTLIVKPKMLTVKWPDSSTFTYDGSERWYAPQLDPDSVPSGAKVSLKLAAASTTKATDAGAYTVQIVGLEGDDADKFTLADADMQPHEWSIKPIDLVVTAIDNEIAYGDAPTGKGVTCKDSNGADFDVSKLPGTLQYSFEDAQGVEYKQYGDVGTYTITPSGLASPNYNITFKPGTLTVNPREVSLTWPTPDRLRWTGSELTYGTPILGNVVNGDDVRIDKYTGNKGKDGGSYTAKVESLAGEKAANYTLPSDDAKVSKGWSIYGAENKLKVKVDDWTYGNDPDPVTPTVEADFEDGLTVGYSKSPYGPFDSTVPVNSTTNRVDAGTYYVRAAVPATAVYDAAEVVAEFHVLPREATLTWANTSFKYDTNSHVPDVAVGGVLEGDTCAVLDVSGAAVDAGVYTATAIGLDNPNYKLPINDSVQFTIARATLTVTANPNEITYGDAPAGNGVTCIDENNESVSVESLSGTLSYSFDYKQFDDVSDASHSYKITPGGLSSPNYAITYVPGELTVKPRVVTLTWDAPSTFTYDATEHTWNPPTVGNTVNGDTLTATWAQGAVVSATNAGTYTPAVGGLTAGANTNADNYALPSPAAGTWSIVPAANTMSVSIAGWTYGKYTAACGPTVTAAFGASPNNITYTYYTDANCTNQVVVADMDATNNVPKNVGSYWVKATIPAGPNNNYPAAEATCAFTISKADITVTADDKQSVRQDPGTIVSLTCSIGGDVASWDSLASYFQATSDDSPNQIKPNAAGSYTIKATWATGKSAADLSNYNVKFVDGTYTVTRLLANVVASGSSWVYDGTDTDSTGKRKDITVEVNDSLSRTALDGGSSPSVVTYYTDNAAGFSNIVDTATMTKLQTATTIDADFKTKFNTLKTNLTAGNYATTSPAYKDAGTHRVYFIVVSDQATPDVMLGYKDVVVTPAPLVVTANDKGIAYGDPAANDGVKYAGLVAADLDGSEPKLGVLDATGLTYGYGTYVAGSVPGKYPITPSGLVATPANYSITYQPGTLTVGAKELALKWPDENEFPYNGSEQTYQPELIDPSTGNAVTGADVSVQMAAGTDTATNAGSYTATVAGLTGSDAGNYVLKSGTQYKHAWSITPVKLTVTANDNSIVYGAAPAAAGVTYAGLLTPEDQAGFTGSLSYSYDYAQFGPVGTYAITPSGIASPNYKIDFEDGELTVLKKQLSLEWSEDNEFEYTDEPWTYDKPLLDGVVDGDIVRVGVYQGATQRDVGLYTASVVSLTGRDKDNYVLSLPASHPWMILGVENGVELTMDGWMYGEEPSAPELTADHDGDKATFAYYLDEACEKPVPAADLAGGVPAVAGSYWVKATVPKSDAGNYREAEAKASFTVERRPITVKAADQIVKVGDAVATDAGQVTADDLAEGDKLSGITISASSPTASPSFGGSVTPSAATIQNAAGRDVTSSYDITYEPGELNVVGDYSTENGKVIYVVLADIWVTVAEAAELLADPDLDDILMERTGANVYETGTGESLEVEVADRGGLAAVVGVYTVTFKTNPEVSARVHVMSSSSTDDETGVTVYANDTEPKADLLRRAKAGDADAVAALIALAGAVAVDEDGNTIPVTGVDLSAVDPDKLGTYRAVYSTDDGDSAAANVVLKEGADEPDPKDGLREKVEEAEGIVGPLDPANPTDEEKKLLEEIDAAKLILDDPDATPEQIRDAIKRLDDAIAALKAARDDKGGAAAGNASATKPDSARKAATAKTGDALPVALLTTTALAAACALAFAYRRRENRN